MGQSSSSIIRSNPSEQHFHYERFPNNLLVMGSYFGYFATSHFKDWHRIDLHTKSSQRDMYDDHDDANTLKLFGTLMKQIVGGSLEKNSIDENNNDNNNLMREDYVPNVSYLSEFAELSSPIVQVVSSGNCQLFIDLEKNVKMYRTSKFETHDFTMKNFRVLERNGFEKRNLIMIGSNQTYFYFIFKDMTIVVYNHERNLVQVIDFCKESEKEIIDISRGCTGDCAYILTRKQDEYELLVEKDGCIGKAEIGDLVGQLNNVRFLSKYAVVTNDNKIYILAMIISHNQGFKYRETTFENKSQIIQLESGFDHCVVLTQDGKVYAMGINQYSQCGMLPDQSNIVRQFVEIIPPTMYHSRVLRIGCGSTYTALLTESHILIVGRFTGSTGTVCKNRIVHAGNGTPWLVSKNLFGINDIYCAGWHLCAIQTTEINKERLFARLLNNSQWFSDVEILLT
ncbi:predicted protein [Naegleria gruberi]|uniref:Predicted protein n=1 Tax=Naegleria gruberi TaxID=5762 RepID=D2W4L0_NAEGR|nr:uncharacterized protein NAEGRDRAFT_76344 [Naegleria gruberi]EFC35992.1 predicted protein [Naegleria gruberi]|eukprot:XP_002668736.1 predicted protein [Naegleria gruberi strain NEG-M]